MKPPTVATRFFLVVALLAMLLPFAGSAAAISLVSTAIFSENFDGVTAPALPAGWATAVVTPSDAGYPAPTWQTTLYTNMRAYHTAHSNPNVVSFNAVDAKNGSGRLYRTSGVDLSAAPSAVLSFWMFHESFYSDHVDSVQPQVSVDGGASWVNVGSSIARPGPTGWVRYGVDISAYTGAGKTDVRVGFLGISAPPAPDGSTGGGQRLLPRRRGDRSRRGPDHHRPSCQLEC